LLLVLAAAGTRWYAKRIPPLATAAATQTVVVIPFDNLGAPDDAYFADGITEEIAGRLARVPGLSVVARASVLRFRGSHKSPQDIARELGADYALSGSIRWARVAGASGRGANDSTMVRIVPALIRVSTGAQIWGEPLQQRLTDVFKVQADVAERVASALSLTLGAADLAAVRRPESMNADARDAQLLGRFLLKQRGLNNLRRAAEHFERAIALDSSYARAWAGYAETIDYLPLYGDTTPRAQSSAVALNAARRAIALDSMQSDAHVALATVYEHDQRFTTGLQTAERAIRLDSGNAQAWKARGVLLLALGRVAEAESPLRRALALEPLSPVVHEEFSIWFLAAGQVDSSIAVIRRVVLDNEDNVTVHWYAELTLGIARKFVEARAECIKAAKSKVACEQLWGDARGTRSDLAARAQLDAMSTAPLTPTSVRLGHQAALYAQLGVVDSAFSRLQRAVRTKDPTLYCVINSAGFAPLQQDRRWTALIQEYRGRQ
ncbi:tetratricopeptide repeat protein, partial [Gemmatimonas sp.]|uniref:tetratricopeptide repeat protein n=1 Tax=Gemmatimonas sp. TaxID=1962908 RepID=UPI00286A0D2C